LEKIVAVDRIITREDDGFLPVNSISEDYLSIEEFDFTDSVKVSFLGLLNSARQQISLMYDSGPGVSIVNRSRGDFSYKLSISKSGNNITFDLDKTTDTTPVDIEEVTVDIKNHDWFDVRFSTRDVTYRNKIFLQVQYRTNIQGSWKTIISLEDTEENLWRETGEYFWVVETTAPEVDNFFFDNWLIQRYSNDNNDLSLYLRNLTYTVEEGFVDVYTSTPVEVPFKDSFEDTDWENRDKTKPSAAVISYDGFPVPLVPPSVGIGDILEIGFEATDNLSDLLGFEYRLNDGNWVLAKADPPNLTKTIFIPAENSVVGLNTLTVRAIDNSNNSSDEVDQDTFQWFFSDVDTTPPETSIIAGPEEGSLTFLQTAQFQFEGTDDVGVAYFEYRLDAGSWIALPPGEDVLLLSGLSLGPHTLEVRAYDFAGNVDATPAIRNWTVADFTQVLGPATLEHWLDFTDPLTMNDNSTSYVYFQGTPSTVWTVSHPLNEYPTVTTVNNLGEKIWGDVQYIDDSTVEITFTLPESGVIYLNGGTTEVDFSLVPSSTWEFTHSLSTDYPHVTTVDTFGNEIIGAVSYDTGLNKVIVEFIGNQAGFMYLNSGSTYEESILVGSDTWVVNHGLGEFPSVLTVNDLDQEIIGNIVYTTKDSLTISFVGLETGKVILNSSIMEDGAQILTMVEKSVNAAVFDCEPTSSPIFDASVVTLSSPPLNIGGAVFSSGDILNDSDLNANISGSSFGLCLILLNNGDSFRGIKMLGGAASVDYGINTAPPNSSFEAYFSDGSGNYVASIPNYPYEDVDDVSFVIWRVDALSGTVDIFLNGQKVATQAVDSGWTLGGSVADFRLGAGLAEFKILHSVVYKGLLTDPQITSLFETYSELYDPFVAEFDDTFTGAAATDLDSHLADTGQSWTEVLGDTKLDGLGAAVANVVPAFNVSTVNPTTQRFMIILEEISNLSASDDNYLVFGSDLATPSTDYFRIRVENTGSIGKLILLEEVASGTPTLVPGGSLSIPWTETLGLTGSINIALGIDTSTGDMSFGAGLAAAPNPVVQSDEATPWTGDYGSKFVEVNLGSSFFGNNTGFRFDFSGAKCERIKLIERQ
jgi:hypothetical protein